MGVNPTVADPMYGNFAYTTPGDKLNLTFSGLPSGTYDFYTYGHSDTSLSSPTPYELVLRIF